MNTFKDYVKYRLRSSLLRTVAFAVIAIIITYYSVSPMLAMWTVPDNVGATFYYKVPGGIYVGYIELSSLSILLLMVVLVIAVLEMMCFKNKRNLDTLHSLPLSRSQLALAHYVSGALQAFAIHTVCVLCTFALALPYAEHLKLWILPAYYVFSLIFGLGLYSFVCFFFSEGNTLVDGIIFAGAWLFVLYAFLGTMDESYAFAQYIPHPPEKDVEYPVWGLNYDAWGMAAAPLTCLATIFTDMIGANENFKVSAEIVMNNFYMFYVWAAVYVACAYGFFRSFVRRSAEKAGEISDSPFGYKFLIPFYGFCFFLSGVGILYSVFIFALMFIGYVIYRRGVKLRKSDIGMLALSAAIMILITASRVAEQILPFGSALVLTIVCLARLIRAICKKMRKGEVAKRAVLFVLAAAILALLTIGGWDIICHYTRAILYLAAWA